MKALLIVGMQTDLLPGGPAEVPGSHELVPVINALQYKFECVVAAHFHTPADHLVFAANHPWRRPGQIIAIDGAPTVLRHISCVPGSFGAEPAPGLSIENIAFIAEMGTSRDIPPYSAFFDAGKKRDTGLLSFLKEKNVKELYIAGIPLEEEVRNSALDAQDAGFNVHIVAEACRARSNQATTDSSAQALDGLIKQFNSHD